jgi:hypothetical protein
MKVGWIPPSTVAIGGRLLGDLQGALGLVNHGGDGGGHHHVRGVLADDLPEPVVRDVLAHGIHEANVLDPGVLQGAADVGHPARRPVAGDLGTARVVVGLDHQIRMVFLRSTKAG